MFLLLRSWSLSFAKPNRTIKLEISPHLHDHPRCIAARIDAKKGASRRSGAVSGIYLHLAIENVRFWSISSETKKND
jgi:hypothetical protein